MGHPADIHSEEFKEGESLGFYKLKRTHWQETFVQYRKKDNRTSFAWSSKHFGAWYTELAICGVCGFRSVPKKVCYRDIGAWNYAPEARSTEAYWSLSSHALCLPCWNRARPICYMREMIIFNNYLIAKIKRKDYAMKNVPPLTPDNDEPVESINTAGDLRKFLCQALLNLNAGLIDPQKATSIAKVAAQVNESFKIELGIMVSRIRLQEEIGHTKIRAVPTYELED